MIEQSHVSLPDPQINLAHAAAITSPPQSANQNNQSTAQAIAQTVAQTQNAATAAPLAQNVHAQVAQATRPAPRFRNPLAPN
jgi:hypothetical protein